MSEQYELEGRVEMLLSTFPVYRSYVVSERLSYEFLEEFYNSNGIGNVMVSGSFREGHPDLMYSDVDVMVVLNPSEEMLTPESQSKVFQTVDEAPAHVKFIIPRDYIECFKEKYHTISTFLDLLETDEHDSCFVSAERTRKVNERDFLHEHMADKKPSAPWTASATAGEGHISVAYTLRGRSSATTDRVPAIECVGWPNDANEWKIRQPRNWPSEDLVESISSSGFMIVPKPSDISGDMRREWRLSFSKQEAKLFDSFNECQAKVYYLLRSLYVRYLKEKVQGALTSYHIKTVMFWILEKEEHGFWSEESTLEIFFRVLRKLLEFTKDGFCPHYFIPKHNLFYKASKSALEDAASELAHVLQDPSVAFGNLVNEKFIGLMPRLGLLSVEVKGKLNRKILSLSRSLAYTAFTNPEKPEFVRNLELGCWSNTLEEFAISIKAVPDGLALIQVYLDAILQGHQFAFTIGKSEVELTKIEVSSVEGDFFEMDAVHINLSLVVWLKLGKIAVDNITQGRNDNVFSFFHKVYAIMKYETGPFSDEEEQTVHMIQTVGSATGKCLAAANFKADDISYQELHESLCGILPPNGSGVQSPCNVIIALFVLAGATCKMAKSFSKE